MAHSRPFLAPIDHQINRNTLLASSLSARAPREPLLASALARSALAEVSRDDNAPLQNEEKTEKAQNQKRGGLFSDDYCSPKTLQMKTSRVAGANHHEKICHHSSRQVPTLASTRSSWVDMESDVILDGRSAVNGLITGRRKNSWKLPWKLVVKWRSTRDISEQRHSNSAETPVSRAIAPPTLPPLSPHLFPPRELRLETFLGDGETSPSVRGDHLTRPPDRSSSLPLIQEHPDLSLRDIAPLPQRGVSINAKHEAPTHPCVGSPAPISSLQREHSPAHVLRAAPEVAPALPEASASPTKSRRRTPSRAKQVSVRRSPARTVRVPRPTESLPVPPRQKSKSHASSRDVAIASSQIGLIPSRSADTPSEQNLRSPSIQFSNGSVATTVGSSVLCSDIEIALRHLLTQRGMDSRRDSTLQRLTSQANQTLSMPSTVADPSLKGESGSTNIPTLNPHGNASSSPSSMQDAERQLASILIQYLRLSAQNEQLGTGEDGSWAELEELGDVTAVIAKLESVIGHVKEVPPSTSSRRFHPASSPKYLRTPSRYRAYRGEAAHVDSKEQLPLTPDAWRRDELRRYQRPRSSAITSSIGESLLSYCSTAATSSVEDVGSLLDTMLEASEGEGNDLQEEWLNESQSIERRFGDLEVPAVHTANADQDLAAPVTVLESDRDVKVIVRRQDSSLPLSPSFRFNIEQETDGHCRAEDLRSPPSKRKQREEAMAGSSLHLSPQKSSHRPIRVLSSARKQPASPGRRHGPHGKQPYHKPPTLAALSPKQPLAQDFSNTLFSSPARSQSTSPSHGQQSSPTYEVIVNQVLLSQQSSSDCGSSDGLQGARNNSPSATVATWESAVSKDFQHPKHPMSPTYWPPTPPLTDSAAGRVIGAANNKTDAPRVFEGSTEPPHQRSDTIWGQSQRPSGDSKVESPKPSPPFLRQRAQLGQLNKSVLRDAELAESFAPSQPCPPPALVVTDADVEAKFKALNLKFEPGAQSAAPIVREQGTLASRRRTRPLPKHGRMPSVAPSFLALPEAESPFRARPRRGTRVDEEA